jgi:hypothetical protein
MKKIHLIILLLMILTPLIYTQEREDYKRKNKIEQLERLKMIEVLDLDEETSIRFFSRRNEHQKEIEEMEKKSSDLFYQLEKILKSGKNDAEVEQKKIITDLMDNREKIELKRKQFILSLSDILTTGQISKYVLFEKRFREELRKILLEKRRH